MSSAAPDSVVYFLERFDGAIKIGYTENFRMRLYELVASHGPLTLLAMRPGGRREEQATHARLHECRLSLHAEWFVGDAVREEVRRTLDAFGHVPPPTRSTLLVQLSVALKSRLQRKAREDGVTISDFVRRAITQAVGHTTARESPIYQVGRHMVTLQEWTALARMNAAPRLTPQERQHVRVLLVGEVWRGAGVEVRRIS